MSSFTHNLLLLFKQFCTFDSPSNYYFNFECNDKPMHSKMWSWAAFNDNCVVVNNISCQTNKLIKKNRTVRKLHI